MHTLPNRSSSSAHSAVPRVRDIPRSVAFDVLRRVTHDASFANLILPKKLAAAQLSGQEAGFVTDAVYGTLRWRGLLDAIVSAAAKRDISKIDASALEVLRLGAYQILFMNVPDYAAVSSSVDLIRTEGRGRLTGFVNAVIRKITQRNRQEWEALVVSRIPKQDRYARLATRFSHPEWIVRELDEAWEVSAYGKASDSTQEGVGVGLDAMLAADNEVPDVTLVARPGLISREQLRAQIPESAHVSNGLWSPYALRVKGVNPADIPAVRLGTAGVEDEGSQLAALAMAAAPTQLDHESAWLDMCAGPGGKTALLGALAGQRGGITLSANEPSDHRAELVRQNVKGLPDGIIADVTTRDGRDFGNLMPEGFDRILVDAPCSGLGALRRRPEARWMKTKDDIAQLTSIQQSLLESAVAAVRPGGIVAYVTCSPVIAETRTIVDAMLAQHSECERLDTGAALNSLLPDVSLLSGGGDVQLFSHLHNTDQMFISLIRKNR